MPPKFQSSFIPKGPLASGVNTAPLSSPRPHDLTAILAKTIFALSVLAAFLATGYKFYLNYSIKSMTVEIEEAREALAQEGAVSELIRLNSRISSTSELLSRHWVASPLFDFFEANTPRAVRITKFEFEAGQAWPMLAITGIAQSYSALALQADLIYKSSNFRNPVFSEIRLDDRGNVNFAMRTEVNPELLSYEREIGRSTVPATQPIEVPPTLDAATSTATSSAPLVQPGATETTN